MKNIMLITFSIITLLNSCGSIKTKDKNQAAIDSIKSVAITSFSLEQPASADVSFNLGSKMVEGEAGGGLDSMNLKSKHVDKVYEDLRKAVHQNLSWRTLSKKSK